MPCYLKLSRNFIYKVKFNEHKMAFAIYLKTESSDGRMYVFDGEPSQEQIQQHVEDHMEDEFFYVSEYKWDATYEIDFQLEYKHWGESIDENSDEW
jgi:hypothetical protein